MYAKWRVGFWPLLPSLSVPKARPWPTTWTPFITTRCRRHALPMSSRALATPDSLTYNVPRSEVLAVW